MNRQRHWAGVSLLVLMSAVVLSCRSENLAQPAVEPVDLPPPEVEGTMSVEAAIEARRSVRSFTDQALTMEQIGQLTWAAQGITDPGKNLRASPSAGATYPMDLYAVTGEGIYHYQVQGHRLVQVAKGDLRPALAQAALRQRCVSQAPLVIVLAAVYQRTAQRYGDRAERYVHMEAGHIAQNVHLQAVAMGLGSVPVGAFDDAQVASVLNLPRQHEPIYLVPVGYPG